MLFPFMPIGGSTIEDFRNFLPGCVIERPDPFSPGPREGPGGGGGTSEADPVLPCTININISGADGQVLADVQKEITRILKSGSAFLNVTFNQTINFDAKSGSTNLSIVRAFTGEAASAIVRQGGGSPGNTSILGVTPTMGNNSYVNQSHISFVTANLRGSGASLGTMIGRIGAHEIIQHRLLGVPQEGAMKDITSSRVSTKELNALLTTRFNLNPLTATMLCP